MKCFARRREAEVVFSQPLLRRSSLMRRDPSCCWDYDGVSQCNAVWLAKTHVLVSGDTEILQRFRVLNKISNRKYDCMEGSRTYPAVRHSDSVHLLFSGHLQFIEVLFAGPPRSGAATRFYPAHAQSEAGKRAGSRCEREFHHAVTVRLCVCPGKTSMGKSCGRGLLAR